MDNAISIADLTPCPTLALLAEDKKKPWHHQGSGIYGLPPQSARLENLAKQPVRALPMTTIAQHSDPLDQTVSEAITRQI